MEVLVMLDAPIRMKCAFVAFLIGSTFQLAIATDIEDIRSSCIADRVASACEAFEHSLEANPESLEQLEQLYKTSEAFPGLLGNRNKVSLLRKLLSIEPGNPDYGTKLAFHLEDDSIWESIFLVRGVIERNPDYAAAYFAYDTFLKELTNWKLANERIGALRAYSLLALNSGANNDPPSLISYFNARAEMVDLLREVDLGELAESEKRATLQHPEIAMWDQWLAKSLANKPLSESPILSSLLWDYCNPNVLKFDLGHRCSQIVNALLDDIDYLSVSRPEEFSQILFIKKKAQELLDVENNLVRLLQQIHFENGND